MPTENPRIQVMLDIETSGLLANLALAQQRSVSSVAAELIREALENHEDQILSDHADKRFSSAQGWTSHDEAWK